MLNIRWAGEHLTLFHERALYWPRGRTLFIADVHLGKAASFRAAGVPVPRGTTSADLARLSGLIERTRCKRLAVLGDLLHARAGVGNSLVEHLRQWRQVHAQPDILVVRGNHDRHAGDPPAELRATCVDEPHPLGPFVLRHHPAADGGSRDRPAVAGHLHPVVTLHDVDGSSLRCPCFLFGERSALLPAFGSFTGGHPVRAGSRDRVFAVGPDAVVDVSRLVRRRVAG